ncbi:MAG TPA: DNA/RNA non-specific endonuclease [Pyrinomonadaceae bacterium]
MRTPKRPRHKNAPLSSAGLFPLQTFKLAKRYYLFVAVLLVALTLTLVHALAAVSLSTTTTYVQNFDTIGTGGTATLPADFKVDRPAGVRTLGNYATAGNATTLAGGTNLSTTAQNGIYNFGATANSADRAIGFVSSGTGTTSGNIYTQLVNNTGGALSGLQISYDVEKYRNGSNPAGFSIQMYYSTNGTSWTSAGSSFLTSFPADTNNNGFTPAPGATVPVSATLSQPIPNGSNFYLAWNYSVTSGSTTTNAQALAVDNINILGVSAGGGTNPTGVGAANPNSVAAGGTTLLTVAVTPGTNPVSTGLAVSANLSPIGGSAAQPFFDDGTNGDVTAGDNIFSFSATVANATTGGAKNLTATITDAQSRTANANISLTVTVPTPPSGVGAANPGTVVAGGSSTLTVTVTPGSNPTSTGITVTGNLSAIGGSSSQPFFNDGTNGDATAGDNIFSYLATVAGGTTSGVKNLPVSIADAQSRTANASISLSVQDAPVPPGAIVLSQVYGGGGNSGATLKNDFIELFNRTSNTINLNGWSVQYASSGGGTGATWTRKTTLTGSIGPGQYYLIREAEGSGGTVDLPQADDTGTIAMGGTDGKVALVNNDLFLPNGCPIGNPNVIDFVGYGSADCYEGFSAAPVLSSTTAALRARGGCKDTDNNGADFSAVAPNPRNKLSAPNFCPPGDAAPEIFNTTPASNATNIALASNIIINVDEPVSTTGNWFQISCTLSGLHTATATGGPSTFTLNPDTDFVGNEQCTVTVFASQVNDLDTNDPPDNMSADYSWTFATIVVRDPAEHMVMGNPSGAVTDINTPLDYLMLKPQYALSYNNDKGTANWTSWHLDSSWVTGVADRQDDFRSDDQLPASFKHVSSGYRFATYGFDRGHMTPSADRTSSIPDNSATFLMTNMIPQASGNNQGPWASMEDYIRTQLSGSQNELYIVSGGTGVGGNSTTGHWDSIIDTAGNSVTVPQWTWKVVMVLPNASGNDVARVDASTRTFAVIMPNNDNIRPDAWQKYLATVDQVEALTGYNFFSNVPENIQNIIEARLDEVNDTAPVATGQSVTTAEDTQKQITLTASDFNVNNVLTYTIVTPPSHGSLTGTGATLNYLPDQDYFGPDSFTFKVNDGGMDSNVATVNINVTAINDTPVAANDGKNTAEDAPLSFSATDLTVNDTAGPANESAQTLTVTSVTTTPDTHGTAALNAGQITYTPADNYNGPASFDYRVCDNGTTNGTLDAKCSVATVNVEVSPVNDAPDAANDSATLAEDSGANAIDVLANDSFTPDAGETLSITATTDGAHGTVAITGGGTGLTYTPAANYFGPDSFTYTISDGNGGIDTATVNVNVTPVNDPPIANAGPDQTVECTGGAVTLNGTGSSDIDPGDTLSYVWTEGSNTLGTGATLNINNLSVGLHTITLTVTDSSNASSQDTMTINVIDNSPPTITLATQTIVLSSSNHQYETINLTSLVASASDACDSTVDLSDVVISSVTSDEADNGNGDGNTFNDIAIAPDCKSAQLRAERSGGGNGRVYTITFLVRDTAGNTTTATATVTVPKNNSGAAIDDGPQHTVTSNCQ